MNLRVKTTFIDIGDYKEESKIIRYFGGKMRLKHYAKSTEQLKDFKYDRVSNFDSKRPFNF